MICGLLAGVATGTRSNYVVLIVPVLFAVLLDPQYKDWKEKISSFIAFCAGFIAAIVPAGILFLLAPRPFIYGNFHYIALNTIYRKNLGYDISMNLLDKFSYFFKEVLSNPADLLLYIGFVALFIVACILWKRTGKREAFIIVFIDLFAALLLFTGFAPTPLWPQYFFGPVPFLIVGLFWGLSVVFRDRQTLLYMGLFFVFAVLLIPQPFTTMALQLRQLATPEAWTTTKIHNLSEDIRASSGCVQKCKMLTLAPILPLEAGMDTYPMFAVGSFSWRTAPILSKERRAMYGIISYMDLPEFLENDPPAIILTGTEAHYDGFTKYDPGGLDQPFIDYAVSNNYHPVNVVSKLTEEDIALTIWVNDSLDYAK